MDISQSGSGRGPNTGARGENSGPTMGAASNGGSDSSPWLSRPLPQRSSKLEFTKSRILYSYAYSNEGLEDATDKTFEVLTTPHALIPVDFLPFYLSPAEFSNLPIASKVESVWCKIYPLGTRTAFDTGTTLSGTATSEYIPIGVCAIGLNVDFHGQNMLTTGETTNPMVPTQILQMVPQNIVDKYYMDNTCCAMGVPRSISEYFSLTINKKTNPLTGEKAQDYDVNDKGIYNLDYKLKKFLINGCINKCVVDYKYNVRNGEITNNKYHTIPYPRRNQLACTNKTRGSKNKLEFFHTGVSPNIKCASGQVGFKSTRGSLAILNNQIENAYKRQLENYGEYNMNNGCSSYAAQPQVHVGIIATPQLNPQDEKKNFLNSCCYWKVDCGITISTSPHSAMTAGALVSWHKEVTFKENANIKYTDGVTMFGNIVNATGTVSSMRDILTEYEVIYPRKKSK